MVKLKKGHLLFGFIILFLSGSFYFTFLSPWAKQSYCVENGGVWDKKDKECVCGSFQEVSDCIQKLELLDKRMNLKEY